MRLYEKIIWSEELSVGNRYIDHDHRNLLDIYNKLTDLAENGGSRADFAEILSEMTDYARNHFKKEEEYMHRFGFPKLEEHRSLHKKYISEVAGYNMSFVKGIAPDMADVLSFIEKWWVDHILNVDIEYEQYKQGKGAYAVYG